MRSRAFFAATSVLLLVTCLVTCASAQAPEVPDLPLGSKPLPPNSPIFRGSKDPQVIARHAHLALSRLKLAYALLSQGMTSENIQAANVATTEAYYFLRAAHESTVYRQKAGSQKFPDPLLALQADQLKVPRYAVPQALSQLDGGAATPQRAQAAAATIAGAIESLEKAVLLL